MRVIVAAPWSHFRGREGSVVEEHDDYALVLLDCESKPLRFGWKELLPC